MRKTNLIGHLSCSVQKTARKKTPNIREMRPSLKQAFLQKLQPMQRLQAIQNGQFGSKIKDAKNMRKAIVQEHQSWSWQKTDEKTPNIGEIRRF